MSSANMQASNQQSDAKPDEFDVNTEAKKLQVHPYDPKKIVNTSIDLALA
jgi:hypothetical protein